MRNKEERDGARGGDKGEVDQKIKDMEEKLARVEGKIEEQAMANMTGQVSMLASVRELSNTVQKLCDSAVSKNQGVKVERSPTSSREYGRVQPRRLDFGTGVLGGMQGGDEGREHPQARERNVFEDMPPGGLDSLGIERGTPGVGGGVRSSFASYPHIPKSLQFNGEGGFEIFKYKLERYLSQTPGRDDQAALDTLTWCCVGKAADYLAIVFQTKRNCSYGEVMERLEKRFGKKDVVGAASNSSQLYKTTRRG